jgi:hypothetical protein
MTVMARCGEVCGYGQASWFAPDALRPQGDQALRLRGCDYRACEARCCYDGVYLKDGEPERIQAVVASDPGFFAHLPEHYIVHGDWPGVSGPKTAVRPHSFHSPDFPEHFNQTRCVFAFEDGACSLQAFAGQTRRGPLEVQAPQLLDAPAQAHRRQAHPAAPGARARPRLPRPALPRLCRLHAMRSRAQRRPPLDPDAPGRDPSRRRTGQAARRVKRGRRAGRGHADLAARARIATR